MVMTRQKTFRHRLKIRWAEAERLPPPPEDASGTS